MRRKVTTLAATGAALAAAAALAAGAVENGNFESGSFAGWEKDGVGGGSWHIYSQTDWDDPDNAPPGYVDVLGEIPAPRGRYSPTLTQGGPSGNVLLHELRIPARAETLKLKLYWATRADRWNFKDTWKPPGEEGENNSYFAVELIDPDANPFSARPKDVLKTIFAPDEGSLPGGGPMRATPSDTAPTSKRKWVRLHASLERYRGERVTLRLAEIDDIGPIAAGIDDVKIKRR
jgi:hypothetical protein